MVPVMCGSSDAHFKHPAHCESDSEPNANTKFNHQLEHFKLKT